MTAVVAVQVVAVLMCRWRSTEHSVFLGLSPVQNLLPELRCELVRGRTNSRYGQFETSPEMIEQELQPIDCEQRKTERFKENNSIVSEALN